MSHFHLFSKLCLIKCMTTCFVQLLLTVFLSNFWLYVNLKWEDLFGHGISPLVLNCIFSNLQQKCISMIKNRISFPKWFFRTDTVGRGFLKDIFQTQWPSACVFLPPFWPAQMLWIPFHHLIQQKSQLLALGIFLFPLTCGVVRNYLYMTISGELI